MHVPSILRLAGQLLGPCALRASHAARAASYSAADAHPETRTSIAPKSHLVAIDDATAHA